MRKSYKIALPAVVAAGLLLAPGALTSSASAASASMTQSASTTALTLGESSCEELARRFVCGVTFSGAVEPASIRWFLDGNVIPSFNDRRLVAIGCQPTFRYDIRAVISDVTGASVEFRTLGICRYISP